MKVCRGQKLLFRSLNLSGASRVLCKLQTTRKKQPKSLSKMFGKYQALTEGKHKKILTCGHSKEEKWKIRQLVLEQHDFISRADER